MTYFKTISKFVKKQARVIRIILLLLFLTTIIYLLQRPASGTEIKIGKCQFEVEVVKTAKAQFQGLSNRESLARDKGMLFLFDEKKDRSFVMRDMLFPLDIIFISDNRVISLHQNLTPEGSKPSRSYESGAAVDTVLEIQGGLSRACVIGVGSEVSWK